MTNILQKGLPLDGGRNRGDSLDESIVIRKEVAQKGSPGGRLSKLLSYIL